jgi:hypothetical protein
MPLRNYWASPQARTSFNGVFVAFKASVRPALRGSVVSTNAEPAFETRTLRRQDHRHGRRRGEWHAAPKKADITGVAQPMGLRVDQKAASLVTKTGVRCCGHKGHRNVIEHFSTISSIETIFSFISMGSHKARRGAYFIGGLDPLNLASSCRTNLLEGNRRFPMKHLIISAIAAVAVIATATTMLSSSYSPSTERHAASAVIGKCKNFHSLAGAKASDLLPY